MINALSEGLARRPWAVFSGLVNINSTHHTQWCECTPKGVYPQSDGSLAIVDIDASKGFVDLWEHLALAIFANFDV